MKIDDNHRPLRILIDMDGVVADLMTPWLEAYNTDFNDNLALDDIKDWHWHKHAKCDADTLRGYLRRKRFFEPENVPPVPGAIEGAGRFVQHARMYPESVEVAFCTTPAGADSAAAKIRWLNHRFGGDDWESRMFLCAKKHWIHADVLIDDKIENLDAFRRANPRAYTGTIRWPFHPDSAPPHRIAENWPDLVEDVEAWVINRLFARFS